MQGSATTSTLNKPVLSSFKKKVLASKFLDSSKPSGCRTKRKTNIVVVDVPNMTRALADAFEVFNQLIPFFL
jgi:hypothetical protein